MNVGETVKIGNRMGYVLSKREGGYRVRICTIDHRGRAVITYVIVPEPEE